VTDGAMGVAPSWYRLLKAAKYLGVAPWDLATKPLTWVNMAEEAQAAEAHAEAIHANRNRPQG
jgi:hypothetical protein